MTDITNPAVEDDVADAENAATEAALAAGNAETSAWVVARVTRWEDILAHFQETTAWAVAAGAWAAAAYEAAERCCADPALEAMRAAEDSHRTAQDAVRRASLVAGAVR